MPPNAVYVGRPTKWGNPFKVGLIPCSCRSAGECQHNSLNCETPEEAVEQYRSMAKRMSARRVEEIRRELRGKDLACWCPLGSVCHADVLLEIANS